MPAGLSPTAVSPAPVLPPAVEVARPVSKEARTVRVAIAVESAVRSIVLVLAVPAIAATPIGVGGGRDQRGGAERGYCSKCEDGLSEHVELRLIRRFVATVRRYGCTASWMQLSH